MLRALIHVKAALSATESDPQFPIDFSLCLVATPHMRMGVLVMLIDCTPQS